MPNNLDTQFNLGSINETFTRIATDQLPDRGPAPSGWSIGVGGGAPGVNAELEISDRHTLEVLSNLDPPAASPVGRHLRDSLEALAD